MLQIFGVEKELKQIKLLNFAMASKQSKGKECASIQETKGVIATKAEMAKKLDNWKDTKIKFGVTGNSGVGKSSFINAFRGLDDEDKGAAETDVVEKTCEPACYSYPDNPNITLVDLPGVGTPKYPNVETYCKEVHFETYDTFLILTATRFTQLELELIQKIKSSGKHYFLVRTKLDIDEWNENRKKNANIPNMEKKIRDYCYENAKDFGIREKEIFIISNFERDKWDFIDLVKAILDMLPTHQKEALTLSLKILSKDIVKRKVQTLKRRLDMYSAISYLAIPGDIAMAPVNAIFKILHVMKTSKFWKRSDEILDLQQEFSEENSTISHPDDSQEETDQLEIMQPVGLASIPIALAIFGGKIRFYRSQLGLPEKDSEEFFNMKPKFQTRMKQFYQSEDKSYLKRCFTIFMKPIKAGSKMALSVVIDSLHRVLDEMQQLSLDILDDAAVQVEEKDESDCGV